MKNWIEQANKNKLKISNSGNCQLCGAKLKKGIFECVDLSNEIAIRINHEEAVNQMTLFLCVDAHALQHAEIHGRWNNHFHLSRLNLILNKNIKWNYKLSVILSEVINSYKKTHSFEIINSPIFGYRGSLTVVDVFNATNDQEYIKLIYKWANDVYLSFSHEEHIKVEKVSEIFLHKIN